MAGVVQVMFDNVPTSAEHIKSGKFARPCGHQYGTLGGAADCRWSPTSCPATRRAPVGLGRTKGHTQ